MNSGAIILLFTCGTYFVATRNTQTAPSLSSRSPLHQQLFRNHTKLLWNALELFCQVISYRLQLVHYQADYTDLITLNQGNN